MIDGPGELHWCTLYDEDGEPFGETCRCSIGKDHEEGDLPEDAVVPSIGDALRAIYGE